MQTIDLPATLLEFFDVPVPEDMQGRPIRRVIEENKPIRDYAMFGIHGAHVCIFDGTYVYMKAPVSEENKPLYEYTTMPMHMRNLFSVGELKKAQAVPGDTFSFTKGCPVWKIPKGNGNGERDFSDILINGKNSEDAKHIDNNSMVNSANFGDKLFDMIHDPHQEEELDDLGVEVKMANLLQRAMKENDCPPEQFERIGFAGDRAVTEEDLRALHAGQEVQPLILEQYPWTKGAVNTYRALLKFIPKERKAETAGVLTEKIPQILKGEDVITPELICSVVPLVIPEEYVDMVQYFIGLSGRTS